jgi:hypothetical protein
MLHKEFKSLFGKPQKTSFVNLDVDVKIISNVTSRL